MEGNLVIVESPTKARTIQRFLGDGFTVKASEGHIRDLQEKQLSIDIEGGFTPEYVISEGKKKVVAELTKLASKASVIWLASDEDREGEAISWHLCETLGLDKARTRKYGGSGLGLKIVSSILHMHSGSYRAENTDEGVVFLFTLPKEYTPEV